jgi:heptosyltransferase-3
MIIKERFTIPIDIESVLVIQLGDVGDVVWTTPTIWALKEVFPRARVSILIREQTAGLLASDPSVHREFKIRYYQGSLLREFVEQMRLIKELRRERFGVVFDLRSDERGAFMSRLTGAPIRASLFHKDVPFWRNEMFTHLLVEPVPPKERIFGAAEQSLRILKGFGIDAKTTVPKLWVAPEVMERVQQILNMNSCFRRNDNGVNWITVNPFSRWSYKEWAYGKWGEMIDWLWNEHDIASVIVGAPSERSKAAELVKRCSGKVHSLVGMTTLAELAGVLSLSGLHIGVDSAAPHIAAAVGTPTVTVFGPTDWRDWAPVGDQHRVVISNMDCVPCYKKGCDGSERSLCLDMLEVDAVKKVVREVLEKKLR